jgi:hypothetical protein
MDDLPCNDDFAGKLVPTAPNNFDCGVGFVFLCLNTFSDVFSSTRE